MENQLWSCRRCGSKKRPAGMRVTVCRPCRGEAIAEGRFKISQGRPAKPEAVWSCAGCGSSEKPKNARNPSICKRCLSDKIKASKPAHDIVCQDCGSLYQAKAKNAKYCKGCAEKRKASFSERLHSWASLKERPKRYVTPSGKVLFLIDCPSCKKKKLAGFEEAKMCLDCFGDSKCQKESSIKRELQAALPEGFKILTIGKTLSLVKIIAEAESFEEMKSAVFEARDARSFFAEKT